MEMRDSISTMITIWSLVHNSPLSVAFKAPFSIAIRVDTQKLPSELGFRDGSISHV
jgi:hypothetical protein